MEENQNRKKTIKQYIAEFPYIQIIVIVGIIVVFFIIPYQKNQALLNKPLPQGWTTINPPEKTTCLLQWGESVIAGDNKGVYRIDIETGKVIEKFEQEINMEYVKGLMVDKDNKLWVCHVNGASKFDGKKWINFNVNNGLPDNRANCILQDSKSLIWIGTSKGIAVSNGKTWKTMTIKDGLKADMVNVIAQHSNGSMFFGAYLTNMGGVSCLYNGKWQYFDTKNGLTHDYINCFYEDSKNGMWVGTGFLERGGTSRLVFKNGKWIIEKTLTTKNGLAGEKVCAIFEQPKEGIMWYGSEYDGISFVRNGRWSSLNSKDGIAGCEVKSILFDSNKTMWFATPDGISRITNQAIKKAVESHLQ